MISELGIFKSFREDLVFLSVIYCLRFIVKFNRWSSSHFKVKLILKLVLLALKPMHRYFKGYPMLETSLNYLGVLVIPETSLELFVALVLVAIVILASYQFVMDLLVLDLLLILELLRSIMLLKQSFIQSLLKNQLEFNLKQISFLRQVLEHSKLLFTKFIYAPLWQA